MQHEAIQSIVLALALGVLAYVAAARLKVSAILFYLLMGLAAGPMGLGIIRTDALGMGLVTLVEIAIAIILFEGGLSLPPQAFRTSQSAIQKVIFLALPLTGLGCTLLGTFLLDMSWKIAVVFGSLMVVTGPTAIGPLLRSINISRRLEVLLRYEAIWGDCVGVLLSALAIELINMDAFHSVGGLLMAFVSRILVGLLVGIGAGFVLARIIIPFVHRLGDPSLPGMVALASALALFFGSNELWGSSGALAVAVAGFTLSYHEKGALKEVRRFKDQLAMLFISMLFVLLFSSIDLSLHYRMLPGMLLVAGLLCVLIRPLAMLLALGKTNVTLPERIYAGFIGPRGIIAIAVASYIALTVEGYRAEMTVLVTAVFVAIGVSGIWATMASKPLAWLLKVRIGETQSGIILVGANPFSLEVAKFLAQYVPVKVVDTNPLGCGLFRGVKAEVSCGSALDDDFYNASAEEGFRRVLVMTPNDALNTHITAQALMHFGTRRVFRILARPGSEEQRILGEVVTRQQAFHLAFHLDHVLDHMAQAKVRFEVLEPRAMPGGNVIPLVEIKDQGVKIVRAGNRPQNASFCMIQASTEQP